MAKYSTIQKYVQGMKDSGAPVPGGENANGKRTIDADSATRNYVAQQLQRLADSGVDLGEGSKFYENVYGKTMNGFGDGFLYLGDSGNIGSDEMEAMAYAMQQLDGLQSSGQIDMDTYQSMMLEMISPDGIDSLEAHGEGKDRKFMDMLNRIDNLSNADVPDEQKKINKAANQEALADTREVINDKDDYLRSARSADPSRADGLPEGFNHYDKMVDILDQAKAEGHLDDAAYTAAMRSITSYDNNRSATDKDREILLYAMEDSLATGDSELIGKIMSPSGINAIGNSYYAANGGAAGAVQGIAAVDILRDLEDARAKGTEPAATQPGFPSDGGIYEPVTSPGVRKDMPDDKMQALADQMTSDYFSNAENGITMDEYSELKEQYDALGENAKEGFRKDNPEFAKAEWYMGKIDALQDGVASGRFSITESTDEHGNTTYGIAYNDPEDQKLRDAIDKFKSQDDRKAEMLLNEPDYVHNEIWMNPDFIGGDTKTVSLDLYAPPYDRSPMVFPDDFIDGINDAMPEVEGIEAGVPEITEDFDAELKLEDLALLDQKSPMEEFEERKALAQQIWNGELGNGADRKAALEAMGYDETARAEIQKMVDQGMEWCQTATAEDYDKIFGTENGTMAERDAEFKAQQADAAARIMTYEGKGDFGEAYNSLVNDAVAGGQQAEAISYDQAQEYYEKAAHVLDEAYASGDGRLAGIDKQVEEESYGNLEGLVAADPEAGFQGEIQDGELMYEATREYAEDQAQAESGGDEYTPG